MLADRNATGLRDPHAGVAPGLGEKIGLAERARHIPEWRAQRARVAEGILVGRAGHHKGQPGEIRTHSGGKMDYVAFSPGILRGDAARLTQE
jgi:hypothetical protein